MSTQDKINKAIELKTLAFDDSTPEGWDKVYFEQYKRAWRAAVDAIKAEVTTEFSKESAAYQRQQTATRLNAAALPQNIGMDWF